MPTSQNGTVYTLSGKSGAPVIALIHGLGLTRATWNDHLPVLEENYQVLNFEQDKRNLKIKFKDDNLWLTRVAIISVIAFFFGTTFRNWIHIKKYYYNNSKSLWKIWFNTFEKALYTNFVLQSVNFVIYTKLFFLT